MPVSNDPAVVARFFKPWDLRTDLRYSSGGPYIKVDLSMLAAAGLADQVLKSISTLPAWLQNTLPWPHSALPLVAAGREDAARGILESDRRWYAPTPCDWDAAGVYWGAYLEDRKQARACFERAQDVQRTDMGVDLANTAKHWVQICGDREGALQCLAEGLGPYPAYRPDALMAWHPLLKTADAWMELFDRDDWATFYLQQAAACTKTGPMPGFFPTAMAWAAILGNREQAAGLAESGMKERDAWLSHALVYWIAFANDLDRARQCLWKKEWSSYGSRYFRLGLADGMVQFAVMSGDETCFRHARGLIHELSREKGIGIRLCCSAARKASRMGDERATHVLSIAESRIEDASDLSILAASWKQMFHLPLDRRRTEIRRILAMYEEEAGETCDYCSCACGWKELAGADDAVERCLEKGASCAETTGDIRQLAESWVQLLGRPDRSMDLVKHASRRILAR